MIDTPQPPKWQQIKQTLIQESALHPRDGTPFITQQEVCKRFNVSPITAEHALNELVREGVLFRRRGHGTYVAGSLPTGPNVVSALSTRTITPHRAPADGRSADHAQYARYTLGCLVKALEYPHLVTVLSGIEEVFRETGTQLLVYNAENSAEKESQNIHNALADGIDGMFIFAVDGFDNEHDFALFHHEHIPIVMIDRYYPTVSTDVITLDYADLTYRLTEQLIGAGHRFIGTIWGEVANTSAQEQLFGHLQALRAHNLPITSDLVTLRPYGKMTAIERSMMLTTWLAAPYTPTAYLVANNACLELLAADLGEAGVQVEDTLEAAVIEYQHISKRQHYHVTTQKLPSFELGTRAAWLLLKQLHGQYAVSAQRTILPIAPSRDFAEG